jgi:hypothetical protein
MNTKRFWTAVVTGALLPFLLTLFPQMSLADSPPAIVTLNTLEGKAITPIHTEKGKAAVLIFITTDCPIANSLSPEINRLYKHYQKQGIQFTLVHVDPELSVDDAKKHAGEYSLKPPIVIDRNHQLVKAGKAIATPQTAVFNNKSELVYTGRLNNQWADFGKRRAKPSEHNLRITLDAVLAGNPVPKSQTIAVGCYIPELD